MLVTSLAIRNDWLVDKVQPEIMTRTRIILALLACGIQPFLLWELLSSKNFPPLNVLSTWTANDMEPRREVAINRDKFITSQHTEQNVGVLWTSGSWSGRKQNSISANSPGARERSIVRSLTTTLALSGESQANLPADRRNGSKVLCVHFYGRLGNQLFQYASVLGLALTTKRIPVFLGDSLLKKVLKNISLIDDSFQYTNRCKEEHINEHACCKFFEGFLHLNPGKDYTIGTYLQSFRYFHKHEATISQALTFKDSIMSKVRKTVTSLRQKYNRMLTGVHVRRGDMLHLQDFGCKTAPYEYLVRAMGYVKQQFGDVVFVVTSDDLKWCHEQFDNASDVVVLSGPSRSPEVDMMILASLDHMIMTVGTYGWWASFLNPGITVYYRDFSFPNTSLASEFNPNGIDFYYPDWIPLS